MSARYWVVGGIYTDTSFTKVADGVKETRLGPFDDYDQAKAVWRAKAMETVDDAHARFSIEKESHDEFWVIGGVYTDTNFHKLANGGEEIRTGPFQSYEAAQNEWKSRSMAAIDDAYARFRIEKL
jgi:Mg2+/Co2+ transporter CorC